MKQIKISKHAYESCEKRGVTENEAIFAVERGKRETAKLNRIKCRLNFDFNDFWEGKYYPVKQVAPVIVEEKNEIIVITVFAYYF